MFTAKARRVGMITIIDCRGRLVMGEPALELSTVIHRELREGWKKFAINMGGVDYIDGAGLQEIVNAFQTVEGRRGQLKIFDLNEELKDSIQMTELNKPILFQTEEDAVASFS